LACCKIRSGFSKPGHEPHPDSPRIEEISFRRDEDVIPRDPMSESLEANDRLGISAFRRSKLSASGQNGQKRIDLAGPMAIAS
jgi:hypothetical protein